MDVFLDPRFEDLYRRDPLVLVDVGARGGLKSNWLPARRHLKLIGFEPDQRAFGQLEDRPTAGDHTTTFFNRALHNRRGPLRLHVARDGGLTSMFEPDRSLIDSFPEADRFDTVEIQQVEADTLDSQLGAHDVPDVDFIKVDTQGSELFILEGASRALASSVIGVEVEVEFSPIYRDQPLFSDVDKYLRGCGYLLFDLRPCYWKRAVGRALGGPYGQIIWADALYLKGVPALRACLEQLDPARRKSKVLKAISISLLYGYYDYAMDIVRGAGGGLSSDEQAVIEGHLHRVSALARALARVPGRWQLAAALHWLWKRCVPRDDAWSVSRAHLGNHR